MSSGFDSIRTFNNTYRKITGITPSEYIKNK
jgi:AraC-like DNA-binding protein